MRVLISADMEGVAGVTGYDDTLPGRLDYERGRRLLTSEVNAAIRGVLTFDPRAEVMVADAHAAGRNVLPEELDRRARLRRGSPKQDTMISGIIEDVEAVLLIGYHGKAGTWRSVLAHTMSGRTIHDIRCNGTSLGEIGLNISYAAALGAIPVLVTGDDTAAAEAAAIAPGIRTVDVKRALGGWAADSLHPAEACDRIEAAAVAALADRARVRPRRFDGVVELEIDLVRPVIAEPLLLVPGLEHNGTRGLRYQASDIVEAYKIVELVTMLGRPGD